MTKQLQKAFNEVSKLDQDKQDAIAYEILEEVKGFSKSQLTAEQRREVERRLSQPIKTVSRASMDALLDKYKCK